MRQIDGTRPRVPKIVTNQTLRIGATMGLPDALASLGEDPAVVLAEAGVDPRLFDNPNNRISYSARGQLVAYCAERTACPHFGLLVGQRSGLDSLGFVGLLAKYSTDVRSAVQSLVRFLHLHVRGAGTFLTEESGLAVFEYQIYHARSPGNEQVGDGAVAVSFNILRELCGSDWKPVEIRFAHRRPADATPYQKFFKAQLRFDTEQYAVVFEGDWLDRELPDISPELRRLLQAEVKKLDLQQGDRFSDQLRNLLRAAIVTGHSSADQIAELFSMHRRTLSRHLSASNTSLKQLKDEIRFEIALQLLEDSDMDIVEIALVLGYSNASAFTRAFRRWSATTPAKWREYK